MSGHVGNLSPKQEQALKQFKENVQDIMKPGFDDAYLLRWLRARSFDLKKSEKMLRDSLAWRKRVGADTILQDWEVPEVIQKYYTGGLFGFDKEGAPIWIDVYGFIDLKGMFFSARKQDLIRNKIHSIETIYAVLREQSEKLGRTVENMVIIFDLTNYGLRHLWKPAIDTFTEILSIFEANYPETLKVCYVINAPRIFPIAYNLVKPFLSEDTKKKIVITGGNWKERLLKDIDADQLPVNWGGTCTDPDGDIYCRSKICLGGKIPESYYIQKQNFVDMSNFTTVTVARGSSLQLDYEITKAGCALRWQFETEGNDIGFGLYRRTEDTRQKAGDMEEIIKSERVNSHMIPESGSYDCDQVGCYVIRFDNTYSWVKPKKVSYLIEILQPTDAKELHRTESYINQTTTDTTM